MQSALEALESGLLGVRVGVAPTASILFPGTETTTIPKPRGIDVPDAGPRAARVIGGQRSPEMIGTDPDLHPNTLFCASREQHAMRVAQATFIKSSYFGTGQLSVNEYDDAKKMCIQKGAQFCWDILPEGLGRPGGRGLDKGAKALARLLARGDDSLVTNPIATLPVMTMSGAFDYATGFKSKLIHGFVGLIARTEGWEGLLRLYEEGARVYGSWTVPHAIMISRTGPFAKWGELYALEEQRVMIVGAGLGLWPRRRHVYGVPTLVNVALLRAATVMKLLAKDLEYFNHHGDEDLARKVENFLNKHSDWEERFVILSDDLERFDQSVRGAHQRSIGTYIYSRYFTRQELEIWYQSHKLPVLGPAWGYQTGGFAYTRPEGGVTTSGLISTSMDGTMINAASVIEAVAAACGWTEEEAVDKLGSEWFMLVWGDDTLIFLPAWAAEKEYLRVREEQGLKSKLSTARVFLKRQFIIEKGADGRARVRIVGIGSRFFSNRVWPEHKKAGPSCEIVALADSLKGLGQHPDVDYLLRSVLRSTGMEGMSLEGVQSLAADPRTIERARRELQRAHHLQRKFLAQLERPLSDDDTLALEVAAGLLGQPGTRRFDPGAITESVGSMKRMYREMLEYESGGRKPEWFGEVKAKSQMYQIRSEAA